MPKASIDKNCCPILSHNDIGLAWYAFHIKAIAVAVLPQPLPDLQFGLGIPTADVRHHFVALLGGEVVSHWRIIFRSSSAEFATVSPAMSFILR